MSIVETNFGIFLHPNILVMIEIWMKNRLVSDSYCNILNLL